MDLYINPSKIAEIIGVEEEIITPNIGAEGCRY